MRKFITFFAENTILVSFLTVFVLVIGIVSTFQIRKELRPPISIDKVTINTVYTGASPEEVERLVTVPLEEEIKAIYGVDRVESLSYTGVSRIVIDLDPDIKNKSAVIDDIFRNVGNVKNLPTDAEDPYVREIKSQIIPVYGVALYGAVSRFELRKWAILLRDEIENISRVSSADITGVREPTIDIVIDPQKLRDQSLSIYEIMSALNSWNRSAPAGFLNTDTKEIPVKIDERLDEIGTVSNLIIRTNAVGQGVKIRQVGTVRYGFKNNRQFNRYNGKENVQITVKKKENSDTIETVDKIREVVRKFEKTLPAAIKTREYRDDSKRIKSKLNSVTQNALLGLIMVVIILFFMLNLRIAIVTALGLPVAFFGSIWAMKTMGYTLNSLTIIGIILVVGMLVDDGIVVAENMFYHFENGKSRLQAAIDGAHEIMIPVIGTVITTILAFLPLVFLSGIAGKFMSIIPVGVVTCLVFSLVECIIILPNHAAEIMSHKKSSLAQRLNRSLENFYRPALDFVIRRRWVVAPLMMLLVIAGLLYFTANFKMKMFPTKGITKFSFNVEGPANTRLEETDKLARIVEQSLNKHVKKYITGYRSLVGRLDGRRGLSFSGPNSAGFRVYLLDEEELDVHPRLVVKKIRQEVKALIPKDWSLSFEVGRHGPPMGKPVEVEVSHDDFSIVQKVASPILEKLKTIKGATDVKDDILRGFKEYVLNIDQKKATALGIDPSIIQKTAMSSFEGLAATRVRKLDDEYDVMVMYPKSYRNKIENLLGLTIKTKYGTYVKLEKIAEIKKLDSLGSIKHINNKRTIVIMASLAGKSATAYEINKELQEFVKSSILDKNSDVRVKFGGEEEKRRAMLGELTYFFLIALLAIYMVLSLVFQSILYPFFVMLIIPFGFMGALLALKLYGEIVTFPALISFVGLTGVVVNDAIILVTHIRNRFKINGEIIPSIVEGGMRRLRPIFITTVTTFVALLPSIYQLGGSDANMRPMAIVLAWGLIMATVMTMLFIPAFMGCLYDVLGRLRKAGV